MVSVKYLLLLLSTFMSAYLTQDYLTNQYVMVNKDTYILCSKALTSFGVETGENIFKQAGFDLIT